MKREIGNRFDRERRYSSSPPPPHDYHPNHPNRPTPRFEPPPSNASPSPPKHFTVASRKTPIKMRAKMFNLDLNFEDPFNKPKQTWDSTEMNVEPGHHSQDTNINSEANTSCMPFTYNHPENQYQTSSGYHNYTPSNPTKSFISETAVQPHNQIPNVPKEQHPPILEPPQERQTFQYHPSDPRSRLLSGGGGSSAEVKTSTAPTPAPVSVQTPTPTPAPIICHEINSHNQPPIIPPPRRAPSVETPFVPKNHAVEDTPKQVNIDLEMKADDTSPTTATTTTPSIEESAISQPTLNDQAQTSEAISTPADEPAKPTIRITKPLDMNPDLTKVPEHLMIYHSCPLPPDVAHIITTVWTDRCPRPRRNRDIDPCGCAPNPRFPFACSDLDCVLYACQEECQSNCEAKNTCQNNRITRMLWKKVEIFDANLKGRGLRTMEKIRKGEFITEYVGIATLKRDLDSLFREYQKESMLYIMALDNNIYLDARTKGSVARYINHGCEPNCKVDRWKVQGITRTGVFALRDIEEGEELMFDYKWDRRRGRAPTKCHCNAATCRGTLELAKNKDLEEEEMEMKLKGYWKKPNFPGKVTNQVINRVIKVYFEGNQEYFVADVCKYDPVTKQHMIIYKTDMEEAWEDLNKVEWMILDEEAEHMVIKRKMVKKEGSIQDSLNNQQSIPENTERTERQFQTLKKPALKNYVILQNAERDELASKFIIDKCQRYFRVHINIQACIRNNSVVDTDEANEEEKAIDESPDGKAWKLTIVGLDPFKAMTYLEKNVEMLRASKGVISKENISSAIPSSATHIVSHENNTLEKNEVIGMVSTPIKTNSGANLSAMDSTRVAQEMVIPRQAANAVKKNLFVLRSKCWNVTINFFKSQSRSKIVARLMLSAALPHDLKRAQIVLWNEMLRTCNELNLSPSEKSGLFPKELGFLAGELTKDQWQLFLGYGTGEDDISTEDNKDPLSAHEDMKKSIIESQIIKDFQETHKCTIWVQPELDVRSSEKKQGSTAKDVVRIFIGCHPDGLPDVWLHIVSRVNDLKRGVHFFPLVKDKTFQSLLEENNLKWDILGEQFGANKNDQIRGSLFQFLKNVVGVNVSLDPSTNSFLKIDVDCEALDENESTSQDNLELDVPIGLSSEATTPSIPFEITAGPDLMDIESKKTANKILEAKSILQAQLQVYRDHFQRQQRWIFGRDWTLIENISLSSNVSDSSPSESSQFSTKTLIDVRSVPTSVVEISDIVSELSLHPTVAAHATIIFYRYMHVFECDSSDMKSEFKLRELLTACVFIANKSQKAMKWKRLEIVLQAAYRIFYSGMTLNLESEEAKRLESRTLDAEKLLLQSLQYDIFWSGIDWIVPATSVFIAGNVAPKAMEVVLSAPILSIGPSLWLWAGPKYAFAVVVGFLRSECLPTIISGLELESSKMLQVVDLVAEAVSTFLANRKEKMGEMGSIFKALQNRISECMPLVKSLCSISHPTSHDGAKWLNIISKSDDMVFLDGIKNESLFRRVISGVDSNIVSNTILPSLENIFSESNCRILFEDVPGSNPKKENIILEGSWRSIAISEFIIENKIPKSNHIEAKGEGGTYAKAMTQCASPPYDAKNVALVAPSPTSSNSSLSTTSSILPKHSSPSIDEDITQQRTRMSSVEGRILPGIMNTSDLTILPDIAPSSGSKSLETKNFLCGNISEENMIEAGLRWWLSPRYGSSEKGALCDILNVRSRCQSSDGTFQGAFAKLLRILRCEVETNDDPMSKSFDIEKRDDQSDIHISFQRWPAKKIEMKERSKKSGSNGMSMGFSAAALQEMQLLYQIHCQIQSPQGHPNFFVPIGITTPSEPKEKTVDNSNQLGDSVFGQENSILPSIMTQNIFNNNKSENESKNSKLCLESYFLVFERTPIALQKILAHSKKRRKSVTKAFFISPALFSAWFYDIVSALAYSHMNNIVLRTVHPDQLLINEIGEAKVSNLARTIVLPYDEREKYIDPLINARNAKKMGLETSSELSTNPYISPEMLLGSTRYTKESDIWSVGCLMAHLLVNKSLFAGAEGRHAQLAAIFKVVGTPSDTNYPDAKRFPHYERSKLAKGKEYKKGVLKALQYHLKGCKEEYIQEYTGAMDLLVKMLDLDPKKRIKPAKALKHDYMIAFASKRKTEQFRRQFRKDWMELKSQLSPENENSGRSASRPNFRSPSQLKEENARRRKHMIMEAMGNDNDDDDLYNMDEGLLNFGSQNKKPRTT